MEFVIGDEVQLEMKVGDNLLFGGTYKCTNKFPIFAKEDLKPGMVVEFRNGELCMAMPSKNGFIIINSFSFVLLKEYDDNLLSIDRHHKGTDIMKVYGFSGCHYKALDADKGDRELIWERREFKQMTVGEVKKIAEEKIGERIEVVDRLRKDRITVGDNVFTDVDKAINYLKKIKTLKQFTESMNKPKYKAGDKFFFEDLSTIEIPLNSGNGVQKRWMKTPLSNVVGEIKIVFEEDDLSDTKYRVDIEGHESKNIGCVIFTDYILETYGKKINC